MTEHGQKNLTRRTVAVLCAARKTSYREIPGVEIYDEVRDARTFPGGMPVIAHPPCRRWTTFGANMLKATAKHGNRLPTDAEIKQERELGLWCARQVQENGGILEQPAGSKLFESAGLPLPGLPQSPESFSLHVWQAWWGYPLKKGTWLYFCGISKFVIEIPFVLRPLNTHDGREWDFKISHSSRMRSHTVPAFANWLVDLARTAVVSDESSKIHV